MHNIAPLFRGLVMVAAVVWLAAVHATPAFAEDKCRTAQDDAELKRLTAEASAAEEAWSKASEATNNIEGDYSKKLKAKGPGPWQVKAEKKVDEASQASMQLALRVVAMKTRIRELEKLKPCPPPEKPVTGGENPGANGDGQRVCRTPADDDEIAKLENEIKQVDVSFKSAFETYRQDQRRQIKLTQDQEKGFDTGDKIEKTKEAVATDLRRLQDLIKRRVTAEEELDRLKALKPCPDDKKTGANDTDTGKAKTDAESPKTTPKTGSGGATTPKKKHPKKASTPSSRATPSEDDPRYMENYHSTTRSTHKAKPKDDSGPPRDEPSEPDNDNRSTEQPVDIPVPH